jgi:hypothetical protein
MLSDLVRQLDSRENDAGVHEGLEPKHACGSPFDGAMILLDNIVQVLAGANFDLHPLFWIFAP